MADGADAAGLIALIDRLEELLERSALSELEVQAGGTTLILRTPGSLAAPASDAASAQESPPVVDAGHGAAASPDPLIVQRPGLHPIAAPLTGLFYLSPAPGAAPYVRVDAEVSAGQVIGLIEAMKLFNEIKSDATGVVRRITVEDGALVKARQVLIEVERS